MTNNRIDTLIWEEIDTKIHILPVPKMLSDTLKHGSTNGIYAKIRTTLYMIHLELKSTGNNVGPIQYNA